LDNDTVTAIAAVVGTGIAVANFSRQGTDEVKEKVDKLEQKIDSLSSETKDEFKSMGNKMEKKIDSAVTDISKLGEKTAVISVKLENVESATEKLEKTMMLLAQDFAKRDKAWEARLDALETRLVGMLEAFKPPFRNGIDGVQLTFAGSPEHHVVAPVFVGSPTTAAFQCARDLAPTRLRKVRLMSLATGHFLDEEESGGKTLGMDELSQGLRVFSGAGANSS